MKCLNCGHENPEGNVFCTMCASKLEQGIACPKCGYVNLPGSIFCAKCAARLSEKVYCRFCGSKLTDGRCQNCGRDQATTPNTPPNDKPAGTQPQPQQAPQQAPQQTQPNAPAGGAPQNAPMPPPQPEVSLTTPGVICFIAMFVTAICMLTEWLSVSVLGWTGSYTVFDLSDFAKQFHDLTGKGDALELFVVVFICLTIATIIFYAICAIKLLDDGKEIKTDAFKHMRTGNRLAITTTALVILVVAIVNATLRDETSGYVSKLLDIEFGVILALLIALFFEIYGCKWLIHMSAAKLEAGGDIKTALRLYRAADTFGDSRTRAQALKALLPQGADDEEFRCHICGKPVTREAVTCPSCGAKLPEREREAAPATPTPAPVQAQAPIAPVQTAPTQAPTPVQPATAQPAPVQAPAPIQPAQAQATPVQAQAPIAPVQTAPVRPAPVQPYTPVQTPKPAQPYTPVQTPKPAQPYAPVQASTPVQAPPLKKKTCPYCGKLNAGDAVYCLICGRPFPRPDMR